MRTTNVTIPLTNESFINVILKSFSAFLEKGTSRSTNKLKPLHGKIAEDIAHTLGKEYKVFSQGYGEGKEKEIKGRYYDKKVDITISYKNKIVAGVGVKFVQQNYAQNSNNYFENMLGETANIRTNQIPYFQIFIISDTLPHYNNKGKITKYEQFTPHNAEKYVSLSNDNTDTYFHTPNKTLMYVIHLPLPTLQENRPKNRDEYIRYYSENDFNIELSNDNFLFGSTVILNDYETFREKLYHTIKSL